MRKRILLMGILVSGLVLVNSVYAERINYTTVSNEIKNIRVDLGLNAELSFDTTFNGVIPLYYQVDYLLNESFSFNVYHAFLGLADINYEVYKDSVDNDLELCGFSEMRAGVEYHITDKTEEHDADLHIKSRPLYGNYVRVSYLEEKWMVRKMWNVRTGFYRYTRGTIAYTDYASTGSGYNSQSTYGANVESNGVYIGMAWVEQAHIEVLTTQYGTKARDYFNKLGFDVMFTDTKIEDNGIEPFTTEDGVEAFLASPLGWRLFWEGEYVSNFSMRMELGQRPAFKNDFYFSVGLGWAFTVQL